jgi:hypothetical protein
MRESRGGTSRPEGADMKCARFVYIAGGVWGIAALAPFYWLVDISGRRYAPPVDYPQFFWGFLSVALAWQCAFLLIGSNPARFTVRTRWSFKYFQIS